MTACQVRPSPKTLPTEAKRSITNVVEGLIFGPKSVRENHTKDTHFYLSGVEKFHDLLSFPQPGHFPNQPWSGAMTPHCLGRDRKTVRGAPKAPLSHTSQSESSWREELLPPYKGLFCKRQICTSRYTFCEQT